jgi:hypothetical protein
MQRPKQINDDPTEVQHDRQERLDRSMKELRMWVPDPCAAKFAAEAKRQGQLLRGRREEADALDFIAAAVEWP